MKVYRFEHISGKGPYHALNAQTGCRIISLIYTSHHKAVIPFDSPYQEGLKLEERYILGCSSIQQLHDWFGHKLTELFDNDFYVVAYDISAQYTQVVRSQVVFEANKATNREVLI